MAPLHAGGHAAVTEKRARDVARALVEAGALTYDPGSPVTFRSGLRSPMYVDGRRLIFHPGPWRVVIDALRSAIAGGPIGADAVAGVETAGIPHSSALAYAAGLPSVFVRKAAKGHGLGRRVEGGDVGGWRVALIEDLVTTGGSSLDAVRALREAGATATDCLAIATYGFAGMTDAFDAESVQLTVLTTVATIVDESLAAGTLDPAAAADIRVWLADPAGWSPDAR
jgi:orotate phosphoribosyltransferase